MKIINVYLRGGVVEVENTYSDVTVILHDYDVLEDDCAAERDEDDQLLVKSEWTGSIA